MLIQEIDEEETTEEEPEKSAQAAIKTLIPVPANLRRLLKVLSFVKLDESEKKTEMIEFEEKANKATLTRTVDA